MREIALKVQLRLLAVGRRRQRHHPEHPGADPLCDRLDRAAFPGGVASFEDDDDPQAMMLGPLLQCAQLYLQFAQLFFDSLRFIGGSAVIIVPP
jgi:hypothetical protein